MSSDKIRHIHTYQTSLLHALTKYRIFSIQNSHYKGSLCLDELPMEAEPAPHQTDKVQFHLNGKFKQDVVFKAPTV